MKGHYYCGVGYLVWNTNPFATQKTGGKENYSLKI